jgi:ketosteroid isomerase-like protein
MSEAEDLVRDAWRRWNAGERELDPELFDPEIEIHSHMTHTVYNGTVGAERWIGEIDDQFERWSLGIDEVRPLAADRLLVLGSIGAHARQSGIDLDQPAAWIIDVRRGRLLRIRNFIGPQAVDEAIAEAA